MRMEPVLSLKSVRSGYGETDVIRGITLSVGEGEVVALIGKNGAGKTTLLKTMLGLLQPTAGRLDFRGARLVREKQLRTFRREVGYAPQDGALFEDLSVGENLRLGGLQLTREDFASRREYVLDLFPALRTRLHHRAGTLSGGEQKMLFLGRALVKRPTLVLLDEVSEGVQPAVRTRLVDVLRRELSDGGLTVVLVEQNLDFALALEPRFALMERGTIVGEGSGSDPDAERRLRQHLEI